MNPKICVTSISFSANKHLTDELRKLFPDVTLNVHGEKLEGKSLVNFLENADGAIVGLEKIDPSVMDALPKLKIISKYGVGLDNIDVPYAKSKGVRIGWEGGVNRRSVSELALAFMLGLARNVFFSGIPLKQGKWQKHGGFQLSDAVVGIIGCGFIGEDLLRLLQPFHCKILINDILDKSVEAKCYGASQVSRETLLAESDIVSIHVPLTDETRRFFGRDTLALMKPSAFLINTSRGGVVDQSALKEALQAGAGLASSTSLPGIAGAAIDVFEEEPPSDLEFLSLPNLMVTPHIGGNAKEAIQAMGMAAIKHLKNHYSSG